MTATAHEKGWHDGYAAAIHDARQAGSVANAALFPNGRRMYYEGDDLVGFLQLLKDRYGYEPTQVAFHLPAGILDALARDGHTHTHPLGS